MEMKNRLLQAANQGVSTSDVTPAIAIKPASKKHRARIFMLRSGAGGFTENELLKHCRLSSGRNYASELERQLDIRLERIDKKNPDGIGSHFRYRFTCRADVLRIVRLMKYNASAGGYIGLSQHEINDILPLYPDAFNAA